MPTSYVLDTADRENEAEIQMLAHAQWESELAARKQKAQQS